MVLLNKAALSSFDFNAPMSLLFFQCVVCVVLVRLSALLGSTSSSPSSILKSLNIGDDRRYVAHLCTFILSPTYIDDLFL